MKEELSAVRLEPTYTMVQAEALTTHSNRVAARAAIRNQSFFFVFIFVLLPVMLLLDTKELTALFDKIIIHKYTNNQMEIPNIVRNCINHYSEWSYGRMLDIITVFNTLIFSAMYEEIDFDILYAVLNIVNEEKWDNFSFSEKNEIKAIINKYQNALFLTPHSMNYLSRMDQNQFSSISMKFENDDYDTCLKYAEELLASFSESKYWKLIEKQHGSWTLTFVVSSLMLVYILPQIIKNYSDVYFDIKTKFL